MTSSRAIRAHRSDAGAEVAGSREEAKQTEIKKKKNKGWGKWPQVETMKDVGSCRGRKQPRSKQFHGWITFAKVF